MANEILLEALGIAPTSEQDLAKMSELLAQYCRPYLESVSPSTVLYRGVSKYAIPGKEKLPGMFLSNTLADRKPRDVALGFHEIADQWFLDNMGAKYRSDHIAFTSGKLKGIAVYGKPYIFVPVKQFTFCWSPVVTDLADEFPSMSAEYFDDEDNIDDATKLVTNTLSRANYKTTDLQLAAASGNEIMVRCNQYFLFSLSSMQFSQVAYGAHDLL